MHKWLVVMQLGGGVCSLHQPGSVDRRGERAAQGAGGQA
jgi:hypothetical protein